MSVLTIERFKNLVVESFGVMTRIVTCVIITER